VAELFTEDASYSQGRYREPVRGLPAIAEMWEAERDGPDEVFTMHSEVVAVDGDTGVVRVEVRYGEPVRQDYRDLWIMRFADDGRCRQFEEWPYAPHLCAVFRPVRTEGALFPALVLLPAARRALPVIFMGCA
jgi:ketosteroid isomerase-like protein